MARNQKLSYKMNMNMFHFLTKQNYSKSHFEIEHELSEERILMPYVTSSK